jgi:hypothetical protein
LYLTRTRLRRRQHNNCKTKLNSAADHYDIVTSMLFGTKTTPAAS